MLIQLSIQDFALIDKLNMEFSGKLSVLTGETGAGKSIIIDAVSLLLGARGQSEFIRAGKEKALIEGIFIVPPKHPLEQNLGNFGFNLDEDRLLILTREIALNGKNICRVNNRIVTLGIFKELGSQLINIYGQHDFQALSLAEKHIEILDSLGNDYFKKILQKVEEAYNEWKKYQDEVNKLIKQDDDKFQRLEFLKFQVEEIASINLSEGEDEEIARELAVLNNWEKIFAVTQEGYENLYGSNSAYDIISRVIARLEEITELDPQFSEISTSLETSIYQIEESARFLKNYSENINFDLARKEFLQERKFAIDKLKRKYGGTLKEIIDFQNKAKEELENLERFDFMVEEIQEKAQKWENIYLNLAKELSELRLQIAHKLEKSITNQLIELAMPHTKFKVNFKKNNYKAKGIDNIEFLISPNPGEPLKPLTKIASGGEMSRIMLAFKVILADSDTLTTLIFDEIDSGIGGQVVVKVAEKLYQVGNYQQVICVTHSPHIASLAHDHFKIAKNIIENKTITEVKILNDKTRIEELARMLGGKEEMTTTHAQEMRKKALKRFSQK